LKSRRKSLVIVLGSGLRARQLADTLEQGPDFEVHGFLDDDPSSQDREKLGDRYLGRLSDLVAIASKAPIERVMFALPRRFIADGATANLVSTCNLLGIDVSFPLDLFETRNSHVVVEHVGSLPVVRLSGHRRTQWGLALKRAIDLIGAITALILTAPLWLIAAVAIKLDSEGPIFFQQTRCGRFGRPFQCLKFRTMIPDAEHARSRLELRNEQSGPVFKMKDDPRITRVGRILRRYSIDELPQLVNVVLGDMSLVGPRPPLPSEVAQYEIDHRARLSMRPGITCIWQISGRNEIGFADWVKLDMQYIDDWSLALDLQILLLTIPAVLTARGAS
jgi:exopolysaccharide biosynthesis polyprenyl glycosylphosphotransferase